MRQFLAELKRRHVYKVAVVYAAAAWLLVQIADVLLDNTNAPEWVIQAFFVLALLGFPVALILAWAFDLTPDGVQLTESLTTNYAKVGSEPEPSESTGDVAVAMRKSIAILPFIDMNPEHEQEWLADGITTEIIDNLGRAMIFEVVSWHSAFVYKSRNIDAREAARELGVDYVLEGSLRHAGNRLRTTVALIDALSGLQVWSQIYDRSSENLFELQENIGRAVAAALGGALRWAATERAQHFPTDQLDPIGLVHRATGMLYKYSHHTSEESEQLVRRALEQDPDLAYGHTLLTFILALKVYHCWTNHLDEARQEALAAANRALELEPADSWVLSFTSGALLWLGEPRRAVTLMERAITREPENPLNQESMGHALIHVGRTKEGLAHLENAINLSPGERLTPPLHVYQSYGYTQLGHYEDAEIAGRKGVEMIGAAPFSWIVYANALAENGKLVEAQSALAEIGRLSPRLTLGHLECVFRLAYEPAELAEYYLSGLRKLNWQVSGK